MEAELDKPETISAMKNEQSGEELLQQRYTNVTTYPYSFDISK